MDLAEERYSGIGTYDPRKRPRQEKGGNLLLIVEAFASRDVRSSMLEVSR